jgi:hypothetical protein
MSNPIDRNLFLSTPAQKTIEGLAEKNLKDFLLKKNLNQKKISSQPHLLPLANRGQIDRAHIRKFQR